MWCSHCSQVRKEFSDKYRGTIKESLQNLVHWVLCGLFMLETIVAAQYITMFRCQAYQNPEGSTWGISNATIVLVAKYAITLNIKIVDLIWTPLSTWLSKHENWRTEADLKAEMVVKLFAVKFVVFYYPFAFTIFVQPNTAEGCDGGTMGGRTHHMSEIAMVQFPNQFLLVSRIKSNHIYFQKLFIKYRYMIHAVIRMFTLLEILAIKRCHFCLFQWVLQVKVPKNVLGTLKYIAWYGCVFRPVSDSLHDGFV